MNNVYLLAFVLFTLAILDSCRSINPIQVNEDKITSEKTMELKQVFRSSRAQNGITNLKAYFVWERRAVKESDLWLHFNYTQSELAHRPIDSIAEIRILPNDSIYRLPIENRDVNKAINSSTNSSSYTTVRQYGSIQFSPELQRKIVHSSGVVLRFHRPSRQITYQFKGNRIFNIREMISRGAISE